MSNQFSKLKQDLNLAIAQDGGLAVFHYYGFEPSKRPQKINPFREERTSSFFITEKFGKVIFKDFGDDAIKGDCRKFVQLYEQVNHKEAFKILCKIYNLGFFDQNIQQKTPTKAKAKHKSKASFEKKLLDIQFKEFTQEELQFWWEKGQITPEILTSNQVKSIRSFKIQITKDKIQEYKNLSFVFAYEIVPQEVYKLYMPKPNHRVYAPAKTVFLPSLSPAREKIHVDYQYSFGIDTVKPNQKTILCAGEPDCLALKSAGYNAFTLGDERSNIPAYILKLLEEKGVVFEKNSPHAIIYDTDYTGLKASHKLSKNIDIQRLILPKLSKQKSPEYPKPTQNDICDYLNLYGWDADLHLLLHQEIFQNQDYCIRQSPVFEVNKYLSEQTEIFAKFIQKYKRIQTDADAGIGKTYTMLTEIPKHLPQKILFVVPFAIQVEQIESEYGEKISGLTCFHNSRTQQIDQDEAAFFGHPTGKVNVCTYDRIKTVYEKLKVDAPNNILIVVDESHLLTSEYAYRTRAIHDVLEVCNENQKVVYLSATPDYSLCQFSGFKLIRFKRRENPKIKITPVDYQGEPKKALLQLLLEENKTNAPKIVRLNNKTLAKVIAELLIKQGIYQKEEIDFVFSEKRLGKTTASKESIVSQSLIPNNVKLLFVTACFDCGINVKNTKIDKIISFETRHTDNCKDTFKQIIARFRNLDEIPVYVCKPARYRDYPELKSKYKLYQRLSKDAQNKLELLPYNDTLYCQKIGNQVDDINRFGLNTPRTPRYIKSNQDISAIHKLLIRDKTKGDYQINYNYIRFTLKEYERKSINSNNFYTDISKELNQVKLYETKSLCADPKKDINLKLKNLLQQEKEQRKERVKLICKAIQDDTSTFFDAVQATYRDLSLKEKIKKLFNISTPSKAPKLDSILKKYLPKEITSNFDFSNFDEEINQLSHRYFFLNELLVPKAQIPKLLEKFYNDVNYGILTKTLINQVNLYTKQKTGKNASKIITDYRKLDDIQWLELLKSSVKDFKATEFHQRKTTKIQAKIDYLEYDLKILTHQKRNLFFTAADILEKIYQGAPQKSKLRLIKRKLKSLGRRIKNLKFKIHQTKVKLAQSTIKGFEIHDLSDQINQLKPHSADWQGTTANIRLLSSLFEVKMQKRAILTQNNLGQKKYTEKNFIMIGKALSFEKALTQLGFTTKESRAYREYLDYQIRLDLQENLKILSRNPEKSTEPTIVHVSTMNVSSEKPGFRVDCGSVIENENGYPGSWDVIFVK